MAPKGILKQCVMLIVCQTLLTSAVATFSDQTDDTTIEETSAAQGIVLDLTEGKLDQRLEACNRTAGMTRYFVKPGINGRINAVQINGHTIHMPTQPLLKELLCSAPFDNKFTLKYDDETTDVFTVTADGIEGGNREDYLITSVTQTNDDEHVTKEETKRLHGPAKMIESPKAYETPKVHETNIANSGKTQARSYANANKTPNEPRQTTRMYLTHEPASNITSTSLKNKEETAEKEGIPDIDKELEASESESDDKRFANGDKLQQSLRTPHQISMRSSNSRINEISRLDTHRTRANDFNRGARPSFRAHEAMTKERGFKPTTQDEIAFVDGDDDDEDLDDEVETKYPHLYVKWPEEKRLEEKHMEEKRLEEKRLEEKPTESEHAVEAHIEEKPTESEHAVEAPIEEKPTESEHAIEAPIEEKPTESEHAIEAHMEEKPTESEHVEEVPPREITLVVDSSNPDVLEDTVEDIVCYKGTNGAIIGNVDIEGKVRHVGGTDAKDTVVCVSTDGANYDIAVGNLDKDGNWHYSYYKKNDGMGILIDVTIKMLFRNVQFEELFKTSRDPVITTDEPLFMKSFSFNGRRNASLKQLEVNGTRFLLESVSNGYYKNAKEVTLTDRGACMRCRNGMALTSIYSYMLNGQAHMIVSLRDGDVVQHNKYTAAENQPSVYQIVPYTSKDHQNIVISLNCFDLNPRAKVAIVSAENIGVEGILYGLNVKKFGDVSLVKVPKRGVDTILLIGTNEVLLRADANHTLTILVHGEGVSADISSEKGSIISRTIVTPNVKDGRIHDILHL
ncbi:uncharacterized protein BXIN_1389 [Babesia sp. Xinjiang]|uniref:uncharacterized protein n=1 Tax=Babesia sp. Xinjiang TaxID=462227 RepID=UPI000A25D49C|nr:uncharacterized protein BXIN_1389 [Babesia sp. Xinjiang]ORM39940.1 hypothetical protein BXIN_1389 [Babesia sp. Xinjiang]